VRDLDKALIDLWNFRLSHGFKILDALIARSATEHGATLYTFNTKDFSLISISMSRPTGVSGFWHVGQKGSYHPSGSIGSPRSTA
jgi:hypothetical protein